MYKTNEKRTKILKMNKIDFLTQYDRLHLNLLKTKFESDISIFTER